MILRACSRPACGGDAVATLTYDYSDQMVVVGPLSVAREPHTYDLCRVHLDRLNAPVGWQVIRHSLFADDVDFSA